MSPASAVPSLDRSQVGTTYRSYKRAGDRLAAWLASTVTKSASNGSHQAPTQQLSVDRFNRYTDQIIDAIPVIDVPLEIVDFAQKAFRLRQEQADLLQSFGVENDDGHQHIISVLKEVYGKLKRRYNASRNVSKPVNVCKEDDTLVPSFQLLEVEPLKSASGAEGFEERQIQIATPDLPRPKMSKSKKGKLKKKKKCKQQHATLEEDDYSLEENEDPFFVLMCLLSDLKSMREYIREIWQEYKDGKVDLITASLTTNATFDIIRTYEDDFPAISSLLSDYSRTMQLILTRKLGESDEGLALFLNPCIDMAQFRPGDIEIVGKSLSRISKWADLTFANAFYFLNGPRQLLVRRKGDKMEPNDKIDDPFAKFRPPQDKHLNVVQRLRRDVQILAYFARMVYKGHIFQKVTHDHFSMHWHIEFAKTDGKRIPLAHAFGAQIYLDIYHILKRDMKRGFDELHIATVDIDRSIKSWDLSMKDADAAFDLWETSYNIAVVADTSTFVQVIHSENTKWREMVKATRPLRGDSETDRLLAYLTPLEMNPLLCGIILFQSVHQLRDAGLFLARYFDSIKRMGQLYWGCQNQRHYYHSVKTLVPKKPIPEFDDPLKWDDMDFLFDILGDISFFDGTLPQSNNDFIDLTDQCHAMQSECRSIRQGKHIGPISTIPKKEKIQFAQSVYSFEPIAAHHRLFYSKYTKEALTAEEGPVYDWNLETLQALLENHAGDQRGTGIAATNIREKDGDISQINILRYLKKTLQKESRALRFDFLSFHCRCLRLLRLIILDARLHHKEEMSLSEDLWTSDREIGIVTSVITSKAYEDAPEGEVFCTYFHPRGTRQTAHCRAKCKCNASFWTTKRLVALDTLIKKYLKDKKCSDKETKKIDGIWGVLPK